MAILTTEIQVPVLCPINFSEPTELLYYPEQEKYIPKIKSGSQPFQIRISDTYYNDAVNAITLKMLDIDGVVGSPITLTKAMLSTGFYYAYCDLNVGTDSGYVQFELYHGTTRIAESLVYERNPTYTSDLKTITFSSTINDFGVIFNHSSYDPTFKLCVECGFIPSGFKVKSNKEDFTDQNMDNSVIFAMPYETEILTLGDSLGIPNWLVRKLNYIFMLQTVLIDSIQYVPTPEANIELVEGTYKGLGIYSIELQKTNTFYQ
jgi:hypothetical protein